MRPGLWALQAATAGGLVLSGRAVLGHPPPLPWAVGCLGGYLALIALGVAAPRWQMWAPVRRLHAGSPALALALDGGPLPDLTLAASRVLIQGRARATFFASAGRAAALPGVLRTLVEQGHEVGVLGPPDDRWLSLRAVDRQRDELARAVEAIERACGRRPTLLRPPGGLATPRLAQAASDLDLDLVAPDAQADADVPERQRRRLLNAARGGAVLALREGAGAVAVLPDLLAAAADRGLGVRGVSEIPEGLGEAAPRPVDRRPRRLAARLRPSPFHIGAGAGDRGRGRNRGRLRPRYGKG